MKYQNVSHKVENLNFSKPNIYRETLYRVDCIIGSSSEDMLRKQRKSKQLYKNTICKIITERVQIMKILLGQALTIYMRHNLRNNLEFCPPFGENDSPYDLFPIYWPPSIFQSSQPLQLHPLKMIS
jgi:hypothetical protein